jgi:hypothetical protein
MPFLHLIAMSSFHCIDTSIFIASVQPVHLGSSVLDRCFNYQCTDPFYSGTIGSTGRLISTGTCPIRHYKHLVYGLDSIHGLRNPTNLSSQTRLSLSEEISSRVAECTHLILVKDGFGGDLGALDRCADERRKDTRI